MRRFICVLLIISLILMGLGCSNTVSDRPASANANLSSLIASEGSLSPTFSTDITSYTVTVDNATDSIILTGTAADANATLSANNGVAQSLSVGANVLVITITAEDGTTAKEYTITVNRTGTSNADLSSLTVSEGTLSPAFAAGTTSYAVDVAYGVTSVTVTGVLSDSNATVSENNGAAQDLSVGDTVITIRVTAQDGATVKDYSVTVTRAAPSENADLSALAVSAGTLSPTFSADTTAYTVSVAYSVASVAATGTKADEFASVSANSGVAQSLSVGDNAITIRVTAQDGTTKDYTVTVTRAAADTDANLTALAISAGTLSPTFDSGTTAYTASVAYGVSSVTLTGTKSDENASVSENNGVAQSLSVGDNSISIVVTAEDGTTVKTYTVTVTRAEGSSDADLSSLKVYYGGSYKTLSPAFDSDVTEYTLSCPINLTSIEVLYTLSDSNATTDWGGITGKSVALAAGANNILITVTSENGAVTKEYNLTVMVPGILSTSPNIGNMMYVPSGTMYFDSQGYSFVPYKTVSDFSMSQYEITRSQFSALMGSDPSSTSNSSGTDDPVQNVSWYQAIAFCNKLSLSEGLTPVYSVSGVDFESLTFAEIPTSQDAGWDAVSADWTADGYRLPTQQEYRWANAGAEDADEKAFAGSTGSNAIGDYAVFGYGTGETGATTTKSTQPVGSKLPNELNIYDLSGNIMEWGWDWWNGGGGFDDTEETEDYRGPESGTQRVVVGGNFWSDATGCSLIAWGADYPNSQSFQYGFRVVRN